MKGDMTIGDMRSWLKNRLVTFRCYKYQLIQLTNWERSYHPPTEHQQKYDDRCGGTYCSPSELKIPSPKSPPTRLLNFGPTYQPHDWCSSFHCTFLKLVKSRIHHIVKYHWIQTEDLVLSKNTSIECIPVYPLLVYKEPPDILISVLEPCEHGIDIENHPPLHSGYQLGIPVGCSKRIHAINEDVVDGTSECVIHRQDGQYQ